MWFDFLDEYSKEVWKKKIYFRLTIFFAFLSLVFAFLWLVSPYPKTKKDLVYEYITRRLNFSPDTIDHALSSPYEYKVYGNPFEEEYKKWVKQNKIYSLFIPLEIKQIDRNTFKVYGKRILFSENGIHKEENRTFTVKEVRRGKFLVSEE